MGTLRWPGALLLAIGVVAVSVASARAPAMTPSEELAWQRARWENQATRDYTWTLESKCFCTPGQTTTEVVGGIAIAITEGQSPRSTRPSDLRSAQTVDDLFDQAAHALENDPSLVDISYDSTYGFPSVLHVGEPPGVADAEYTTTVVSFTPMS
jgi:Family of unknown function (DUF6174)